MTDADSIWESKLSRLQDPNPCFLSLNSSISSTRGFIFSKRGEPRSHAPGAQEGTQRPWWRRVFGG
jgi:hypothetical protein